jgi:hypothetical protein
MSTAPGRAASSVSGGSVPAEPATPADRGDRADRADVVALRAVGRHWRGAIGDRQEWRRALPVDQDRTRYPAEVRPRRLGRVVSIDADGDRWHRVLHDNVAGRLAAALKPLPKTVVTTIPFHLP